MSLTEFNAEEILNDCREEGKEIGREIGREEGKEIGREEEKYSLAKNLLKMKLGSPEQISQGTGLSLEKILEIQKEIS